MFRAILYFFLARFVLSQTDDCVPRGLLQRKLCTAMAGDAHVLRVKISLMGTKDISLEPADYSLYRMDNIQRMQKKNSHGKKSRMELQYAFVSNSESKIFKPLCRKCQLQIPKECTALKTIRPGSIYLITATWDNDSKWLISECDDITEWDSLSGFQRSRLLGKGYSCNAQVCFKNCLDDTDCSAEFLSNACKLEREAIECYDKYAECRTNVDGSTAVWAIQEPEFSSCQPLENPFPVVNDLSGGSNNATNVTSSP